MMVVSGYAMKLDRLKKALVLWRTDGEDANKFKVLTLNEIASQLPEALLITVITHDPFSGKIYQYGNYSDGEWWEIGSTGGYA